MKQLLIITLLLTSIGTWAQEGYPVKDIPDSLLKKANVVVRNESYEIVINNEKSLTQKTLKAITILSEKDKDYANYYMGYDLFSSISNFKGTVYDAAGKKVKKIRESDLIDRSYTSQTNLYDDQRIKYYNLDYPNYPFTVVYEVEINNKGITSLPNWSAYTGYDKAIQHTSIKISYPSSVQVRYKPVNLKGNIITSETNGIKTIYYEVANLKPIENELASPILSSYTPSINFSIDKMNYDGFEGMQSTWEEYGATMYRLYKGRDDISPILQAQFAQLKEKPILEIAEAIRSYLDKNTRYISIQMGIGGAQPFKAGVVERHGFGDCKALANFAHVLFTQAGVKSYPTLIKMDGIGQVDPLFPKDYFNHVILCVPNGKDTLWMDCTAPQINLGYLPASDSNCNVLLLSENNGKLVKTPSYSSNQNLQQRTIHFNIDDQGNIKGDIRTEARYHVGEDYFYRTKASTEDQRKAILEEIPFSNPILSGITYENKKTPNLNIVESYSLSANKYGSPVGKRLFIPTVALDRTRLLPKIEKRLTDIEIDMGVTSIDTLEYKLPAGYKVEVLPTDVNITTDFGRYQISCMIDNGTLKITRTVQLKEGKFPASKYNELYDFYKKMNSSDNSKVILTKENS